MAATPTRPAPLSPLLRAKLDVLNALARQIFEECPEVSALADRIQAERKAAQNAPPAPRAAAGAGRADREVAK